MRIIAQNSVNKVSGFFIKIKFTRFVNSYPKLNQSNIFFIEKKIKYVMF